MQLYPHLLVKYSHLPANKRNVCHRHMSHVTIQTGIVSIYFLLFIMYKYIDYIGNGTMVCCAYRYHTNTNV